MEGEWKVEKLRICRKVEGNKKGKEEIIKEEKGKKQKKFVYVGIVGRGKGEKEVETNTYMQKADVFLGEGRWEERERD